MRTGVTLTDITRAADQLLADGERPTVEGIRKVLGTGSPGTVNGLLKEYYQALPARLNLPAPIATAAAELYEKVRATAMEDVSEQRVDLERRIALEREQLAQDRRNFENERATLRGEVAGLSADKQRLQDIERQQIARIAAIEKDLTSTAERAASAEALVKAADEEVDRAATRHATELSRIREQTEGNERHFLARIDELKTQHQRILAEREKETIAATKRTAALELSVSEVHKVQASLRAENTIAQRDLAKAQEAKRASDQALERLQAELVRTETQHRLTVEKSSVRK